MDTKHLGINSKLIHAGHKPDATGSVNVPIYQTSTFAFRNAAHGAALFAEEEDGFIYTRIGNPTIRALEEQRRRIGEWLWRSCYQLWHGRGLHRVSGPAGKRRTHGEYGIGVWSQPRANGEGFFAFRCRVNLCGYIRSDPSRRGIAAQHQAPLCGDAFQSHDASHRHRTGFSDCPRSWLPGGGGQHLRQPLPASSRWNWARTRSFTP